MFGSVIAVDHGTKRTGFASSDPLRIATRPLDVWHGAGDSLDLLEAVAERVEDHGAKTVLVGMPFNMDGTIGPRGADVLGFMARLQERLKDIRILPHDERLSTREAEELLKEAGHHGEARKARKDSWSALVLLREWIEQGEPEREWPQA
ncbi:MAG: putative Holliday junction resolvase [Planctomycetota bacterium]